MKVYRIHIWRGNIFTTSNIDVVNKYRRRQEKAVRFPILIKELKKNV